MKTPAWPWRLPRPHTFKLSHALSAVALLGLILGVFQSHQRNAVLSRDNLRLAVYRRRVVSCVRWELIEALWTMHGLRAGFEQPGEYIEAEKRVRAKLCRLLSQLPDREELLRRMKHEHDAGAWAPGRIRETIKQD